MIRGLIPALLALILAGCVHTGVQPDGSDLTDQWAFSGKMAVRNDSEASSFNVDWRQDAQAFDIELSGPLGQGAARIEGRPGYVTLTRGDEFWQADSLTALARRVADLRLPLDHLQYWVRAKPYPGSRARLTRAPDTGQIDTIEQSGWVVTYSAYYGEGPTALPRKIDFKRDGDSGRLVIRNWMSEG